jgi:hypothetical protein
MRTIMKLFGVAVLGFLLTGCATSTITNLTPSSMPRNATGFYPVEMELDTSQQTLRMDSILPMVVVGADKYAMKPVLKMDNRWEASIPIPASANSVNYFFKVDYLYNRFGKAGEASKLSGEYKLSLTEK